MFDIVLGIGSSIVNETEIPSLMKLQPWLIWMLFSFKLSFLHTLWVLWIFRIWFIYTLGTFSFIRTLIMPFLVCFICPFGSSGTPVWNCLSVCIGLSFSLVLCPRLFPLSSEDVARVFSVCIHAYVRWRFWSLSFLMHFIFCCCTFVSFCFFTSSSFLVISASLNQCPLC